MAHVDFSPDFPLSTVGALTRDVPQADAAAQTARVTCQNAA